MPRSVPFHLRRSLTLGFFVAILFWRVDSHAIAFADERSGAEPSPREDLALFFTDAKNGGLSRGRLADTRLRTIVESGSGFVRGLAVDGASRSLFVTRSERIERVDLTSEDPPEVIYEPKTSPGFARIDVDRTAGKIYWYESSPRRVQRANLDGSDVELLFSGVFLSRGPLVDPVGGRLYYTSGDAIRSRALDGTDSRLEGTVFDLIDVAIDPNSRRLYYTFDVFSSAGVGYLDLDDGTSRSIASPDSPRSLFADPRNASVYVQDGFSILRILIDPRETRTVATGLDPVGAIFAFDATDGSVYWSEGSAVVRYAIDGITTDEIPDARAGAGVAFDPVTNQVVVANPAEGTVDVVEDAGDGARRTIVAAQETPHGVAFDPVGRQVYFTDRDAHRVSRCTLDGEQLEIVLEGNLLSPRGLVIDALQRELVVSGLDGSLRPVLLRADLDGSDRREIPVMDPGFPMDLAIDSATGAIYFSNTSSGTVGSVLDGETEILATDIDAPRGLALAPTESRLYFGEAGLDRIRFLDLVDGSSGDAVNGVSVPEGITIEPGALERCGRGTVGLGATAGPLAEPRPQPVLFVDGSTGDGARTVRVRSGAPFWCAILRPEAGGSGRFVIHASPLLATRDTLTELPGGIGTACVPFVLSEGAMPLAVWNNLGRTSRLGSSRGFDAKPIDAPRRAPNLFVDLPEGDPTHLPPGTRLLFHGVLTDPTSGATVNLSLTNAVEVLFE